MYRYDPEPSVLLAPLGAIANELKSEQPATKKARLTDAEEPETIAGRADQDTYTSLDQLESDISASCASVLDSIKARERQTDGASKRISVDDVDDMQGVMAFELTAKELIAREKAIRAKRRDSETARGSLHSTSNGVKEGAQSPKMTKSEKPPKTVLSLYGNAPTPRQLFSSLQQGDGDAATVDLPLEELGLPNMLTASRLVPSSVTGSARSSAAKATFGDSFAAPASVASLSLPKSTKHASKGTTISFVPKDTRPKGSKKSGYTAQPLSSGDWVTYGTPSIGRDPASPSAKRKQRDRSLSLGESARPDADELALESEAQEEALFKAAFSSFAPSYDNVKAVVPEVMRSQVWWHKVGRHQFENRFVGDTAFLSDDKVTADGEQDEEIDHAEEAKRFKEVVDNFDEEDTKADLRLSDDRDEEMAPLQLLQDISELLETLLSYQRIRNSYIPAASRTPASPSPLLGAMLGTATEPSSDETKTYNVLRSQLADLVQRVPPYIVAKLDGEQLETLMITRRLVMENKSYHGTMEEDQLTRMAKSTAAAAVATASTSKINTPSNYGSINNQHGRTSSFHNSGRPPLAAAQSIYGSTRTPASNFGRISAGTNYNSPSATPRQSTGQYGAYSGQLNRPTSTQSYGHANPTQYGQRSSYGQPYAQGSQASPPPPLPPSSSSASYPPARPNNMPINSSLQQNQSIYRNNQAQSIGAYGQNAAVSGLHSNRSASPATPALYNSQSRYPSSNTAMTNGTGHNGQISQSQQLNQGGWATPTNFTPRPQTPSALGPSGFHTSMTSDQQKIMMERQRAQLAMQPQARAAAQADVSRQSSGTPQPQTNGVE